ncbi:hypothetical protein HDU76_000360 [Blyttiomyces sp. JEL0837]|nr:hypothetical protein HDU76_000360 [Blyttiomyces sp. JEL0837]
MGVRGLWNVLDQASNTLPLEALCNNRVVLNNNITNNAAHSSSSASSSTSSSTSSSSSSGQTKPALRIIPTRKGKATADNERPKPNADVFANVETKKRGSSAVRKEDFYSAENVMARNAIKTLLPVPGKGRGCFPLRVAVDASIWIIGSATNNNPIEGVKDMFLRNAFYRLVRLLSLGIAPVFVFDKRPGAGFQFPARSAAVKKLVELFKIPTVEALHNAEAECAHLNNVGIVDAVLSDDGDAFLYGAKTIIRNFSGEMANLAEKRKRARELKKRSDDDDADYVDDGERVMDTPSRGKRLRVGGPGTGLGTDWVNVFSMDEITEKIGLNRNGLVLAALLSGSDETSGVAKIGMTSASRIAKGPFADPLMDSALQDDTGAKRAIAEALFTELRTNSQGFLTRRLLSATDPANLPRDFDWPSKKLVKTYLEPELTVRTKPRALDDIRMGLENWISGRSLVNADGICEWLKTECGLGDDKAVHAFVDKVAPVLRLRALRCEANRRAIEGCVEGIVEREIKAVEEDKVIAEKEKKAAKKGNGAGAGKGRGKVATGDGEKMVKITDFFLTKKKSVDSAAGFGMGVASGSGSGSSTPPSLKKSATEVEVPRRTEHDSHVDTFLIESVLRSRVRFGTEELRVKWSDNAMKTGIPPKWQSLIDREGDEAGVATDKGKGKTTGKEKIPVLVIDSDGEGFHEEEEEDEDVTDEGDVDAGGSKKSRAASSRLEWVEIDIVKASAPKLFAAYEASKRAKAAAAVGAGAAKTKGKFDNHPKIDSYLVVMPASPVDDDWNMFGGGGGKDVKGKAPASSGSSLFGNVGGSGVNVINGGFDSDEEDDGQPLVKKKRGGMVGGAPGFAQVPLEPPPAPRKRKNFANLEELSWTAQPTSPTNRGKRTRTLEPYPPVRQVGYEALFGLSNGGSGSVANGGQGQNVGGTGVANPGFGGFGGFGNGGGNLFGNGGSGQGSGSGNPFM